ncbi:MAG TPA: protein-L-isoaspartate O-methyltransferase [Rhizomicrobium sp.]|jgi:protein-L-isoaspartate(D-aspartate) O-methyltransferase|nr:protein-L-isoaspartate O-methyltransferase [Rhizomicrobium sp.]
MPDYVVQRLIMVDTQILANGVTDDRLLQAFRDIPRERFVPTAKRAVAYADDETAVVPGRSLLAPRTFAKLLELAEVQPTDNALDVGCATGYSTAVLSRIAGRVIGLEQDADLVRAAVEAVAECGARNASVVQGPLTDGSRAAAPFDVIIVEGAFEQVPDKLLAQLADGGRMVGVHQNGKQSHAVLYLKEPGRIGRRIGFDAFAPVLSAFRQPAGFVF